MCAQIAVGRQSAFLGVGHSGPCRTPPYEPSSLPYPRLAMADSGQTAAVQAVLAALEALYKNPDKQAKDEANSWLQSFQKTVGG